MKRTLVVVLFLLPLAVTVTVVAGRMVKHYIDARFSHTDAALAPARVEAAVRHALNADVHNLEKARYEKALREAAEFIDENMPLITSFGDGRELLKYSLEKVDPNVKGLYCEFGVFTGGSINFIASLTPEQVHGFDSFEGLPEDWRGDHRKGTFKVAKLPEVRPNVVLHKGWFNESLPVFRQKFSQPMSFMHLDADLYSSTKTVFDVLGDRVAPGTIIVFDEFFGYPGWKAGEYRAFREFVESRRVKFEYLGYCRNGQQVAVKITAIGR